MSADPPTVGGGRGRAKTSPPIPTDYDRLEPLYAIQSILAQAIGIEQACDALLPIVTRALRVRTTVLIDTTQGTQRGLIWAATGIAPVALDEARGQARNALAYLTRGELAATSFDSRAAVLPGGVSGPVAMPRHFVTLPLLLRGEVIGVFQLEGALAFDERDLLFIGVLVNQLAVAVDRRHAELELESGRAETEQANRRLRELLAISQAAVEGATLDESLSAVVRAMGTAFATEVAVVLLASADGKTLQCRTSIGLRDVGDLMVQIGSGAAGRIAATGTAVSLDELDELDSLDGLRPALWSNGIRSLLSAPMRARGHLVGVVCVASREPRVFAPEELQLVQLVADRIGTTIDNARLYEHALAAITSRDVVMGVVSHDLRTPLTAIQLSLDLLASRHPHTITTVTRIKRSIGTMTRLVGDLRDVGSIEAGHLSIHRRSEDASMVVRDAIEAVQEAASRRSLRLTTRLPTRDVVLDCDVMRTVQVLVNLLSNAVKFTPEGGSITVSMAEVAGYARFSVEDSGAGIPEEDLPRVFDRYWQATKTAHLGTGLGLAIAKSVVEAHGGTMSVESRVGHGTTFSFTVPLGHAPVVLDPTRSRPTGTLTTGVRVLVIDDQASALAALASLLALEGFVVETAPDGMQALSKLREFAPDILIVDVEMPGLKGPDLVRKVREDHTEIPVILMTGHGDHVVAAALLELNASYIAKPLDIDELVSAIHHSLHKEP